MPTDFEGLGSAELVIGEGVALDVPVAGIGTRIIGSLIDLGVQSLALLLLFWFLLPYMLQLDGALVTATVILTIAGCLVGIPFFSEALSNGRTLGKLAMGTRVVRTDHGPITARHAFVRALVAVFETWGTGGSLAVVSAIVTHNTTRLGDLAAGTIVVKERVPLLTPASAPMPPRLVTWATRADIMALPPELAMGIRQFLLRREQFSPRARARLTEQLLGQVAGFVSPAPPDWAGSEEVLLAVLAERGRRDSQRLLRDEALRQRLLRKS